MTRDDVRSTVVAILGGIAPEVDLDTIRADADLRDELDIDSMDFLRFVIQIQERLGVAIPEADYPRVRSLDGCIAYVAARCAAPGEAPNAAPHP